MEVLEFRKITTDDFYDDFYNDGYAWSRVYEYPLVINEIKKYYIDGCTIHNTSWGFDGIHILFKEKLEELFGEVRHSDILESSLVNTFIYDITKPPAMEEVGKYDIVINVSTLEEVRFDHLRVFQNLFDQVKTGGVFIATFDLLASDLSLIKSLFLRKKRVLQLVKFEKLFSRQISTSGNPLNGENSQLKNSRNRFLNCGIMVLRK